MEDNKRKKEHQSYSDLYDISPADKLNMSMPLFADGTRITPMIIAGAKKYVPWGDNGWTNDYPNKLLRLYYGSSIHHFIIDLKTKLIAGDGLELVDSGATNASKTLEFINKINKHGDDLNDVNYKIILDHEIFNGFSPEISYLKDYSLIDEINHLEFHKVRVQRPLTLKEQNRIKNNQNSYTYNYSNGYYDEGGEINGYFWAFDWSLYRPQRMVYCNKFDIEGAKYKRDKFNEIYKRVTQENNPDAAKMLNYFISTGSTIYYHKTYSPNNFYYPAPGYIGAIIDIEAHIESSVYCLNSLKNGLDISTFITFFGDPDEPDMKRDIKAFLNNHILARGKGSPAVNVARDKDVAPIIDTVGDGNSLAQKYREINNNARENILIAHGITNQAIIGIATPGKLGTAQETPQGFESFNMTYIRPRQLIIEKFWNMIMKYNGLAEVKIKNINIFNENAIVTGENQPAIDNTQTKANAGFPTPMA